MAMYKDTEITASFIAEKFPNVAAEIIAGADTQTISAAFVHENYPEVAAELQVEGASASTVDVDAVATAERERILAIQALAQPGYESVIGDAVADATMTADSVKIKLFDAMNEKREVSLSAHKADGEALGKSLAELNGATSEGDENSSQTDEQQASAKMEAAGKKIRGEK